MKTGVTSSNDSPCVAAIGFFDGVHRGHRYLIGQVREAARVRGWESAVVTFPRHPRQVMQPDFAPRLLTTCDEKLELLAATGLDRCFLPDFTPELSRCSARDFMALLRGKYHVRALVIGYDHRFGHNRTEGMEDYLRYGRELDMEVLPARAYYYDIYGGGGRDGSGDNRACVARSVENASAVSSSLVRRLLDAGEVDVAASALGYDYFLRGDVVDGRHVGRTIGYPTANLHIADPAKLIPADGVYAIRATVDNEGCYGGMLSIGLRPTLHNGSDRSIEAHLFDFRGDLYRHSLRVSLLCRIREERKFDSLEALAGQLRLDEAAARRLIDAATARDSSCRQA